MRKMERQRLKRVQEEENKVGFFGRGENTLRATGSWELAVVVTQELMSLGLSSSRGEPKPAPMGPFQAAQEQGLIAAKPLLQCPRGLRSPVCAQRIR